MHLYAFLMVFVSASRSTSRSRYRSRPFTLSMPLFLGAWASDILEAAGVWNKDSVKDLEADALS